MHAGGKARRSKRSRRQFAAMNRQPNAVLPSLVEVAVRRQKRLGFGGRRVGKAIDVMVAVALGMVDADQRPERGVLLHGKPGLTGQVFARDEKFFAFRTPPGGAAGIDDRLV